MEGMRVFLDSNVIFSVCRSGREQSRAYLLYEIQESRYLRLFVSPLVRDEAGYNLELKRAEAVPFFEELLRETAVVADVAPLAGYQGIDALPDNDRIILSTAVFHGMDYFLTGNSRDYGPLLGKKIDRTRILTPAEFLKKKR